VTSEPAAPDPIRGESDDDAEDREHRDERRTGQNLHAATKQKFLISFFLSAKIQTKNFSQFVLTVYSVRHQSKLKRKFTISIFSLNLQK
jgi:hypothetical protein